MEHLESPEAHIAILIAEPLQDVRNVRCQHRGLQLCEHIESPVTHKGIFIAQPRQDDRCVRCQRRGLQIAHIGNHLAEQLHVGSAGSTG